MDFLCADYDLDGLLNRQQAVIVYPVTERGLGKSTEVAERSGACRHGFSTDFDEEVEKLAREKTALRRALADIDA